MEPKLGSSQKFNWKCTLSGILQIPILTNNNIWLKDVKKISISS